MTKSNKGNITVGTTVVIESLEISDPQVVASVKAAQAENRNLVDYITASVEIGVKALQATGVNLGIEQLADGIANAEKAMGKASKDLATSLAEKLDAIAGDQGSFTLGIECYMQEFTKDLEELTGGENSVIREGIKKQLDAATLAKANLSQGRVLFTAICGACHQMYGQGGKIGPDLTGSGRANIDYLLENIADPSGVVSADYRMSLLTLKDGRVLSGVITGTTNKTLSLRTLTEPLTLDRSEITKTETSPMSMMPEGLLLAFQPDQIRDLIAYLMHPVQVK
jgi:putative heme-binding domain-containing protein